jgi:ubiquitin-protein ligase
MMMSVSDGAGGAGGGLSATAAADEEAELAMVRARPFTHACNARAAAPASRNTKLTDCARARAVPQAIALSMEQAGGGGGAAAAAPWAPAASVTSPPPWAPAAAGAAAAGGAGAAPPPWAPAAAAAAPPWAPGAAAQPNGGNNGNNNAAAQANLAANAAAAAAMFANLFAPAPGGGGGGGAPLAPHHPQQQQQQRFPAPTYPPPPPYPRWWDDCAKASPAAGLPPAGVPLPDEAAALAALAAILGAPLAPMPPAAGATAPPPPPAADAIPLPLAAAPGGAGGRLLTERSLASAVRSRVAPRRVAKGDSELSVLAAAHARAVAAAAGAAPGAAAAQLAALARAALARHVASALEGDAGDDLYFEGGRQRSAFAAALASRAVTPALLDDIVAFTASDKAAAAWEDTLRTALGALKGATMDDIGDVERRLVPLDRLTGCAPLARALGGVLHGEAAAAAAAGGALRGRGSGAAFEARSALAPLLAFSALPGPGGAPSAAGGAPFRALRGYPRCAPGERERVASVVGAATARAHAAAHAVLERVAKQKGPCLEAVLAWLAAAAAAGAPRTLAGGVHAHASSVAAARGATSDAFAVGVASLALRFCRPFLGGAPAQLARLLGGAPYAARWRLDRADEDTLRTGADASAVRDDFDARLAPAWRPFFAPTDAPLAAAASAGLAAAGSADAAAAASALAAAASVASSSTPACSADAPPHFVTQCFHLAAYALHTGLLPAIESFERARYRASSHAPHEALAVDVPYNVLIDTATSALLDSQLAGDACRFALLASAALLRTAQLGDVAEARRAFAATPAAAARDVGALVSFVLAWGRADLLSGAASEHVPVAAAVEAAAALLSRRDLVSSPLVVGALVDTLHAMLAADRSVARGGAAGLGRTGSAAHDALVGAVLANPAARRSLAPALITAYASLDAVEGLDVDRDAFDKFTVRHKIARLLGELWAQPECAASVAAMAAAHAGAGGSVGGGSAEDSPFGAFASAALLDLMYLLQDALARLVDIRDVQAAQADEAAWSAQPAAQRADKERFLEGQEGAARGFMGQARGTLALLNTLAATPAVAAAFLSQPVAGGAAYAAVHFLELLLGPRCEELRVANPEKYKFDPRALLLGIVEFLLRLDAAGGAAGDADAFASAVSSEDDYSRDVLEKAGGVMSKRGVGDAAHVARLRAFIDRCEALRAARRGAGTAAAGTSTAALSAAPSLVDAASVTGGGAAAAPAAAVDPAWERAYVDAMAPLLYADVEPGGLGGYFRQFEELASRPEGQQKAKAKRLAREVGALSAPGGLPLAPGSAIMVRTDGERPDKMRAMLTGPADTPYALGAFVFDIYFPADYPAKAPLVNFDTTGGGRVRFNPNLYADGKVCLSLLGTWHAGHASEKWDPAVSSLSQVLLSIQAMILVDEPWYNEPGADAMRGTPEGARKAAEYNEEIQLFTLRYAMLAQLRKPRAGLEAALGAHFRAAAPAVRAQAAAWVGAAGDATRKARMAEAAAELNAELDKLEAGGGACGGGAEME